MEFYNSDTINLNAGTVSATPKIVLEKLTEYQKSFENNPSAQWFYIWEKLWAAQKHLAQFINANPQDLFLRPNVTYACNDFILGIKLGPGSLAVTSLEYGAVANIVKLRAHKERRRFDVINLSEKPKSIESMLEEVLSQLKADTRLLLLSHVFTGNGLRFPIEKLALETKKRGIILAVDGAHGPGLLGLDFKSLQDVDFYGGNLHKWMMGPKGTGFGWVNPQRQDELDSIQGGWTTFETPFIFEPFAPGHRFAQKMLMASTVNFSSYLAIKDIVDWWQEQGTEKVRQRIAHLNQKARLWAENELSLELAYPTLNDQAPFGAYYLPEAILKKTNNVIFDIFEKTKVTVNCPMTNGRPTIRFTVGYWMEESVVDEGLVRIKKYLASY